MSDRYQDDPEGYGWEDDYPMPAEAATNAPSDDEEVDIDSIFPLPPIDPYKDFDGLG